MLKEYLSRIANSLRAALGTSEPINAQDFSDKITEVRNIAKQKPYIDTSNITDFTRFFVKGARTEVLNYIDTSSGIIFEDMFWNCSALTTIPPLDTSNGTNFYDMFYNCSALTTIPPLDTSNGTKFAAMFCGCKSLKTIPSLDMSKSTVCTNMFQNCTALENVTFIGTFNSTVMNLGYSPNLSVDSMLSLFNALVDLTGQTTKKITLGATNLAKLTDEQKAIATNKNWTVN